MEIGYGNTGHEYSKLNTIHPDHPVKTAGLGFTTSVFDYNLKVSTGISMFNREMYYYPYHTKYIRVPLGVEFHLGRYLSIMGGAGMYFHCLLGDQGFETNFRNRYVIGCYGKFGPGYRFSPVCRILLCVNYNSDLTQTSESAGSRISSPAYTEYHYRDLYLSLGVYYEF